nr:M48 family metalloprotease [Corticibacter populi]
MQLLQYEGPAAAASGNTALAALSGSLASDLAEQFVNAQFSQAQETAADSYAFDLLTQLGLERKGLVTGFQKLASQGGGAGLALLGSHPPSEQRARNMQTRLNRGQ